MTGTLNARSRGDYRADNNRLRDVAQCAARMLARYSWTDDVQRHFSMEPTGAAGYFRDLDVAGDWRALFEALIVAGNIEPDHLGLPDALGSSVFLRIQSFHVAVGDGSEYWLSESMFEVLPGALTYAMVDAAAVELYYLDTGRAVRIVRDVCPTSARQEYLQGIRDLVSDSQVIGLLEAGSTPELQTGYAVIADASENPDGEGGSAFWPARIVLQGVPGPMGKRGPRGYQGLPGVGEGGALVVPASAGGGGRHGHNSFVIDPYLYGVGFVAHKFIFGAEIEANTGLNFGTAEGARDYALWWLHSVGEDKYVYIVESQGAGWVVKCFTGSLAFDEDNGYVLLDQWPAPVEDAGGTVATLEEGQALGAAWLLTFGLPPPLVEVGMGAPPAWVLDQPAGEGWQITVTGKLMVDGLDGHPVPSAENYTYEAESNQDFEALLESIDYRLVLAEHADLLAAVEDMRIKAEAANPEGVDGRPYWFLYQVVSKLSGQPVASWCGDIAEANAVYVWDDVLEEDVYVGGRVSPMAWELAPIPDAGRALVEAAREGAQLWVKRWAELETLTQSYAVMCGVTGVELGETLAGRARLVGGEWQAVLALPAYQAYPLAGPEFGSRVEPQINMAVANGAWLGTSAGVGHELSAAEAWGQSWWGTGNYEIVRHSTFFKPQDTT